MKHDAKHTENRFRIYIHFSELAPFHYSTELKDKSKTDAYKRSLRKLLEISTKSKLASQLFNRQLIFMVTSKYRYMSAQALTLQTLNRKDFGHQVFQHGGKDPTYPIILYENGLRTVYIHILFSKCKISPHKKANTALGLSTLKAQSRPANRLVYNQSLYPKRRLHTGECSNFCFI